MNLDEEINFWRDFLQKKIEEDIEKKIKDQKDEKDN